MWKVECGMRKLEWGRRKVSCDQFSRVECGLRPIGGYAPVGMRN